MSHTYDIGEQCGLKVSLLHHKHWPCVRGEVAAVAYEDARYAKVGDVVGVSAVREHDDRSVAVEVPVFKHLVQRCLEAGAATTVQLPSASCASVRDYATTLTGLFDQCAGAYQDMAGQAAGHAADARLMLESWPQSWCFAWKTR